jgi:hypothetical protein
MAVSANPDASDAQPSNHARPIETDRQTSGGETVPPVEARQGYRGKPVLYVLVASILLLILAYVLIGGFAGDIVQAPPAG